MDLSSRTALVTGASRGIGRASAVALARAGAKVGVNYRTGNSEAADVVDEISAEGGTAIAVQGDVSDADECEQMVRTVVESLGPIDILVNNAALGAASIGYPSIVDAELEQLDRVIRTNLWGPIHLSRLIAPMMRGAPRGDIIMVSSGAAQLARPNMGAYSISKAALETLAHTLALEERPHGTRVNVVSPGLVETEMGVRAAMQFLGTADTAELASKMPFGFICQPDDVANLIVFLCTEEARYITNQTIAINGGGR